MDNGSEIDYETATDFEINKAVALALGRNIAEEQYLGYGDRDENIVLSPTINDANDGVDYCNNPSDAWPIIVENKINITFGADLCGSQTLHNNNFIESVDKNPLRAAMIVFLKMKEAE